MDLQQRRSNVHRAMEKCNKQVKGSDSSVLLALPKPHLEFCVQAGVSSMTDIDTLE